MRRLTVLGGCGAWPEPGRACSGFLLEHDGFRVVLDLGYGTLPRLLALLGSTTGDGLDAVVVTHDHPDHVVDLHGLFRARLYNARRLLRIPLFAPEAVVERVAALEDAERSLTERVFAWQPLPAAGYDLGPFRLESRPLPHYVPDAGCASRRRSSRSPTPAIPARIRRWPSSGATPTSSSSTRPTRPATGRR